MSKKLKLRPVTAAEEEAIRKLARSRTAPARSVQRARLLQALLDKPSLPAGEAGLPAGYRDARTGCTWVKRFNEGGLSALEDRPRSGGPPTHGPEVRSKLLDLATQKPRSLGLDFNLWTLERLQRELEQSEGIHLSDSTIWMWLRDEGLHWKRQQTWFHDAEKHDPEFVEKRGPLSRPTSVLPSTAV